MRLATATRKHPATGVGDLMRYWRDVRGRSQLDLSLESGVSQRHISFIESGRSAPGRQTLMDLAQTLDVPLRDRNSLLLAAGYAPFYPEGAWNDKEMQSVTNALERMLRQHEPFPAVVMDRHWNVLMANQAAPRFFNLFIDMAARSGPRNMLHLMFDPKGMRPFVHDWPAVAISLLQRVYRESVGRHVDDGTKELLAALLAYPDIKPEWLTAGALSIAPMSPVIPIGFLWDGQVLRYFSMVTTVGTPHAVAAQELRLESMFPADEATERRHCSLIG
jgi:transcriptional regulator with XRE-family HTH domain